MRSLFVALWMLFGAVTSAVSQVSIGVGISLPGVSIGINLPAYPELVLVPGYPVYYAPRLQANFFFYDGLYWVYHDDYWYASSWYNGPWWVVEPEAVPLFVLRIPVRYYRAPPGYFRGWRHDAPPRWHEHWGREWEQGHRGWDHWNRRAVPPPAPLPVYQRRYAGDRYPHEEQQWELHGRHYRYQPREKVVRERYPEQAAPRGPAPAERERYAPPPQRGPRQLEQERPRYSPPGPPPMGGPGDPRRWEQPPGAPAREQQAPGARDDERPHGKGAGQGPEGPGRKHGKGKGRGEEED